MRDEGAALSSAVIWRLYEEIGPCPIRDLAAAVRPRLPSDLVDALAVRQLEERCRAALRVLDDQDLPKAQPVGDEASTWKQLRLFTKEQLFALIIRRTRALEGDWRQLDRLHRHCVERFGAAPEVPDYQAWIRREADTALEGGR